MEDDFEKNFFYRFFKVAYVLVFLFTIVIAVYLGWSLKPHKIVDDDRSYITCVSGEIYSLYKNSIYVYDVDATNLTDIDDKSARFMCYYHLKYDYSNKFVPVNKNYTLTINTKIEGSWIKVGLWWILGISGSYIVLNLIRETLNYVFLGKKFDWWWLITPLYYMGAFNEKSDEKGLNK